MYKTSGFECQFITWKKILILYNESILLYKVSVKSTRDFIYKGSYITFLFILSYKQINCNFLFKIKVISANSVFSFKIIISKNIFPKERLI